MVDAIALSLLTRQITLQEKLRVPVRGMSGILISGKRPAFG